MDDFYAARSGSIPPLPWSNFAPPFSRADRTGQSCALVYDVSTKDPTEMRIAVQKTLTVLFVTFAYISFIPWKTPEAA